MKKCKTKRKKYQIGGNIFGVLPGLQQYNSLTSSWNNYWNNGNYFGAGNTSPVGTYADPNAMLYNTVNTNNSAFKAYSDNQNVFKNTYSGPWGDDAHNYYFNKTLTGQYTPEQLQSFSDYEKKSWVGDFTSMDPEGYKQWEKSRNDYSNKAGEQYNADQVQRNIATGKKPEIDKQMGNAITNSAAGIFSGLNYLNSYNPEQKDYWSKGSKGFNYQKGGNVNLTGYTPGTSSFNNSMNIIPSNNITMKNTPFPVLGIGQNGYARMMQPGNNYTFGNSSYVTELPIRQFGGTTNMIGNIASNYIDQEQNRRLNELGANEQFGPMVSTADFNRKMYESTYNRKNNDVTNELPDFAPALEMDNSNEISRMKSTSEKLIYNLKGDKKWEYTKEGDVWLARKKGSKKWIDLSTAKNVNYNKTQITLENAFSGKTKGRDVSVSNTTPTNNKFDFPNQKNYGLPTDGYVDLSSDTNKSEFPYGTNSVSMPRYTSSNKQLKNGTYAPNNYIEPNTTTTAFGLLSGSPEEIAVVNQKFRKFKHSLPFGGNFQFGGEVNNNTIIEPRFEEDQELQAELGEMIVLPNYDITKVKANKLHKHMKDEDVTDIAPKGSYILSNDPRMKIGLKTKINGTAIEDIKLGKSVFEYKENEITAGPKDIYFKDIFKNKKELTPAQLAVNIKNIYKTVDLKNDYFATKANEENKSQRAEYLDILKAISEYKKPKEKTIQKAQYGLQVNDYNLVDPASLYMKTPFGKMDNNINNIMGYGMPKPEKAQLGKLLKYTIPGALPLEMYFKNKAGKKADKLSAEENKRFQEAFNKYQSGLNTQTGISNLGALAGFAAGQNVPREAYDNRVEQIGLLNEMDKRNRLSIAAQMYGYNPAQSNSFNRNALSVFGNNGASYAQSMRSRDMDQVNSMRGGLNNELRNNNSNYFNSLSGLVSARNADKIRTDYSYDSNKYNATVSGINDMTGTFANSVGLKNNFNLYRYNNEEALRRQQNLRKEQMQNKVTSEVEGVTGALGDIGLMVATGGLSAPTMGKTNQTGQVPGNAFPSDYNPYGYDPLLGRGMSFGTSNQSYMMNDFYNANTVVPGFSVNRGTRFNIF